jgi:hypothetical protein
LYLAIVWLIEHLGFTSALAVRLPSVVASVAILYLTYMLGDHLQLPHLATLGAVCFLTLSSFQIHFAQEARMYALLQAEVLVMLIAALRRQHILYIIAATCALYTHNYALFYVGACSLIILFYNWRNILPVILPFVLFVPWVFVLAGQMQTVAGGYWIQPLQAGDVVYSLYMLFFGFGMPEIFKPLAVMTVMGALTFALARGWRVRGGITLMWVAIAPLIITVAASLLWKPILLFRGLAPSAPLLALLISAVITQAALSRRLMALICIAPLVVGGFIGHYQFNATNKDSALELLNVMRSQWQEGDIVYHINVGTLMTWHPTTTDLNQYVMPPCQQKNLGDLSEKTKYAMGMKEVEIESFSAHRVWIVYADSPTATRCEEARAQALTANATLIKRMANNIEDPLLVQKVGQSEYAATSLWLKDKDK